MNIDYTADSKYKAYRYNTREGAAGGERIEAKLSSPGYRPEQIQPAGNTSERHDEGAPKLESKFQNGSADVKGNGRCIRVLSTSSAGPSYCAGTAQHVARETSSGGPLHINAHGYLQLVEKGNSAPK